jgi:hypothetical protein
MLGNVEAWSAARTGERTHVDSPLQSSGPLTILAALCAFLLRRRVGSCGARITWPGG